MNLITKEAVDELCREKFSGRISVCVSNGVINDIITDF
jgi:hypothetical protein